MAKIRKLPQKADFYAQLALEQKDNLLFYDAVLNINEAIALEPQNDAHYVTKAGILALNDDVMQSNELYFYVQRFYGVNQSVSLASNFIRFDRDDLIRHYFKLGIEDAISSGKETRESNEYLQHILKMIERSDYDGEEELELIPDFDKSEEIIELERENFINTKARRESANFAKMITLLERQDFIGAIKAAEMISPSSRHYLDALELKMNAMFYIKDIKGALACAEKLGSLEPCNISMFTIYATLYDEINNSDMAKRIEQKVARALEILLDESDYDEMFTIAEVFFTNNIFSLCVKLLERYVQENPAREESLIMLAISFFVTNRKKEAVKYLRRCSDLFGMWTFAPTIMELLFSDYEIEDYSELFAVVPDKFASNKVASLIEKIIAASKGYYDISEHSFYEQVLSIAKLADSSILRPLFDTLCANISHPIFNKAVDLMLISDLISWYDSKIYLVQSILDNVDKKIACFEGALVIDGLYSKLSMPLELDIENGEDRAKFSYYYKQAITHILRQDYSVDGKLVARITQDVYKSAIRGGFSPKSEPCIIQIICIIYKMSLDGETFEQARYYTENGNNCTPKTLKRYKDILNIQSIIDNIVNKNQ